MFDRNSMLLGAAACAIGMIAGMVLADNAMQADTPPFAKTWVVAEADHADRDVMDFTVPDLSAPKTGEKMSRHGCVIPARPEWAANLPREEAHRSLILKDLYNIGRQQAIIETNSCPCEVEFPSWGEAERLYEELTAGKDREGIFKIASQLGREAGDTLKQSLDICKAWRGR